MIRPLWQILVHASQEDEPLSCDECYILMDYLSDLLAEGIDSERVLSLAERYLSRCPDCDVQYMYNFNSLTLGVQPEVAHGTEVNRISDLPRT